MLSPALLARLEPRLANMPGRFAITFFFSGLFWLTLVTLGEDYTYPLAPCFLLLALAAFPQRRFQVIACTPLLWLSAKYVPIAERWGVYHLLRSSKLPVSYGSPWIFPAIALAAVGICSAYRRWIETLKPEHVVRRWAFFFFLGSYLAVATLTPWKQLPLAANLPCWLLLFALSPLLWFLGYDLEEKPPGARLHGFERIALYRPFWMFYFVAPTKGEAYLRAIEAKTPQELARLQLKALRLLAWAFILTLAYLVFDGLVFTSAAAPRIPLLAPYSLGIPRILDVLKSMRTGQVYGRTELWLAVYAEFFSHMLFYSIVGHLLISTMRMAGFNAFRNTYRPFSARSVAEFFGRYNYYFKEALLHLYYYPLYLRFLRDRPRARVLIATFASVGLGNFLIHFVRDINFVREFGTEKALWHFLPYGVYCSVLTIAISISLLRPPRARGGAFGDAARIFAIVTFFALLRIFDDTFNGNIHHNFALFAQLF